MKVGIKSFDVAMEVKQKGMELEVRSPDGSEFHGDCFETMTGLVWCPGKINRQNDVKIKWEELMEIADSDGKSKAALKAARAVS
ncbi:hypothetical protein V6X02_04310 [Spiribacter sp. 1M153]|uniref:hypothetical protein n=1 Tax=Spiribacter roseus TaxID=1855875 RepID=UPI00349FC0BF